MENLIVLGESKVYTIILLLISLVLLMMLVKNRIVEAKKVIKYLYFIYFIVIAQVLTSGMSYENFEKIRGISYIVLSLSFVRIVDILLKSNLFRKRRKKEIPQLITNIITFTIFIISILIVLRSSFGVNVTSLLATSAIISAVIGLALQDTLTTFIAGLVLTTGSTMEIGDTIEIEGLSGKIIDTNWYSTKLQKLGGGVVSIPNTLLLKGVYTNYYKRPNLILEINVGCSYSDPPNKVKEVLLDVASKNEKVLKNPKPYVIILGFSDFSIDYQLRVWVQEEYLIKAKTETEIYGAIWYALKREGIKIPFPTREILQPKDLEDNSHKIERSHLESVEFFKDLIPNDVEELIEISKLKLYGKDEYIFSQGEEGDSFYVIKSGEVSVIIDDREVVALSDGDFFGEMSLLTGNARNATIKVLSDTEVIVIEKDNFKKLIQKNKNLFDNVLEYLTKREEENLEIKKAKDYKVNYSYGDTERIKRSIFNKLISFFEI